MSVLTILKGKKAYFSKFKDDIKLSVKESVLDNKILIFLLGTKSEYTEKLNLITANNTKGIQDSLIF